MELAATKRGANLLRPTWLGGGSEIQCEKEEEESEWLY